MSQRRLEETVAHFQTELELDPQSPARAYSSACMGWALFFLRRPEEAIPLLQAAWKLPPGNPAPLTLLTAAYAHLGRMEEAAQALKALPSGWPFGDWVNSASTDDDREYFRAGLALAGVDV
jgi:predicted Zn-dependent protease